MKSKNESRRHFIKKSVGGVSALTFGGATVVGYSQVGPPPHKKRSPVIDGMMHLEVVGKYWEGLIDDVIEHYDHAGIDKGVVLTTWTPSRESNDRTLEAYRKYPNRFIPFGHVRPEDSNWESELKRVSEAPFKGLKLLHGELASGKRDGKAEARKITRKAVDFGIRIIKIHFEDYDLIDELTRDIPEVTWILPHMGTYSQFKETGKFCELAKNRSNVFLDTCAYRQYYDMGKFIELAGTEKVTFATDGFMYSPLVEKAIIETLQLSTPFRTPPLTDDQLDMIMGGNMARILGV